MHRLRRTRCWTGPDVPVECMRPCGPTPARCRMKILTAIPVYNEERPLLSVLHEVRRYSPQVLVVDDGSTDGTGELLQAQTDLELVRHPRNRGYGAALSSAFRYLLGTDYDVLITMDCDGQHEPGRIPVLLEALDS